MIKAAIADSQTTIYTAGEDEDERKVREVPVRDYKAGVVSIARCLDGLGQIFGLSVKTLSDDFNKLVLKAGILQEVIGAEVSGEIEADGIGRMVISPRN